MSNTFSYASFTVPVNPKTPSAAHFLHPVKIINPKNNKSVTIEMLVDTGAEATTIHYPDIKSLDIDLKEGPKGTFSSVEVESGTFYQHNLIFQIGNLKPIQLPVNIHTVKTESDVNLLGWQGLLRGITIEITGKKLTYTELAQAAMANAQAYFRSRI